MRNIIKLSKKYKSIVILSFIALILIMLGYIFREKLEYILSLLKDKKQIEDFLLSMGSFSIVVFILLQMLQVIIFFIPGEVIQTIGGYVFGTWKGTCLSILGITIGAAILFLITRKYRERLVNKVVSKSIKIQFEKVLNSKKSSLIIFLIYLLPGMPKDVMILLCGLSKISFKDFMIYSTLGRIPALILSCYYGDSIALGNKSIIIIATIIVALIAIVGIMFKKDIFRKLERIN